MPADMIMTVYHSELKDSDDCIHWNVQASVVHVKTQGGLNYAR